MMSLPYVCPFWYRTSTHANICRLHCMKQHQIDSFMYLVDWVHKGEQTYPKIIIVWSWVYLISYIKASAHSFKQFTSRLLKLSFSLSMHLYNSDGRHAWFHLHGTSRPDRSASEATKYKMKNSLSTVGLEPSTLRFQVWCSTYWASRAWWMLSV